MYFTKIEHNLRYKCCGVLFLSGFLSYDMELSQYIPIDRSMFRKALASAEGCKNMGAKLVQASFNMNCDKNVGVYKALVKLLGKPVYKNPVRNNLNGSSKFMTALWDIEHLVDDEGNFISQKEVV